MTFQQYMFILGTRSVDYKYTSDVIFENIEYFKGCWRDDLSAYKALEWFYFHLDDKTK